MRSRFAPGAWRYALPLVALAAPALLVSVGAAAVLLALGLGALAFFRDPDRTPPRSGVVSPADGSVSVVRREGDRVRVGVFLGVTDVHVVRAPLDGAVEQREHRPGAHRPAFSKESERNERVQLAVGEYDLALIAGAFARRIHPYVDRGDAVERGERVGHIAFGSRVDVVLPAGTDVEDIRVTEGDTVRAGETVIAPQDTYSSGDVGV